MRKKILRSPRKAPVGREVYVHGLERLIEFARSGGPDAVVPLVELEKLVAGRGEPVRIFHGFKMVDA